MNSEIQRVVQKRKADKQDNGSVPGIHFKIKQHLQIIQTPVPT